ncbi:MAG: ABC transporter permease subunit [Clostridia bacterium]|nr:ABC transporter permease subunit [Clostridia bacterium]
MFTIYRHELRQYIKSMLIWFAGVSGMGLICIRMFGDMKSEIDSMAETFSSMGAFSNAFGMDKLSIATLSGFYATEVGLIHSLGGAMFAAMIACSALSKEEEGHTGEFLFSLPVGKAKVIGAKWLAVFTNIVVFNLLCIAVYCVGFAVSGESVPAKEFALFHAMQLFMHTQIGAMCFAVSACSKRNRIGVGLGAALLLYAFDTVARILPDLADYKFISPFSYSNASDIFSSGEVYTKGALLGAALLVISLAAAFGVYSKRDLAS